jgi:hypothetical protein
MTALERVTGALESHGLKIKTTSRDTAMAQCPCHDDSTPSLSLKQSHGRALVYCHAGCQTPDVLQALGLTQPDLFDDRKEVTYHYSDGRIVHRRPDKSFYQTGDKTHVGLYIAPGLNLPAALQAGSPIFIPEGEQDVHTLADLHVAAVTSPMGAQNWAKCDYTPLTGAPDLIILRDRDDAGRTRADGLYHHLRTLTPNVVIKEPAVGKDVTDHIMAGLSLDDLVPVMLPSIGPAPIPTPPLIEPGLPPGVVLRSSREAMKPMRWAWRGVVPMGAVTICVGRGDVGKSTFVLWMAAQFQKGAFPGRLQGKGCSILIISQEDDWNAITQPRLWANGADLMHDELTIHQMSVQMEVGNGLRVPKLPLDINLIEQTVRYLGAQIVIFDPLLSALADGLSGDKNTDVRMAIDPLADLAMRMDIAVVGVAHLNKNASATSIDRLSGAHAWRDAARAVLTFAKDDESGITVVSHGKGNYQQSRSNYQYRMNSVRVPLTEPNDDGEMFTEVGSVEWLGLTERTVDDVFMDEAAQAKTGDLSRDLAKFIRNNDHIVKAQECEDFGAEEHGAPAAAVRQTLARLLKRGTVHRYGRGAYGPPPGYSPDPKPTANASTRPAEFCSDCGLALDERLIERGVTIHPTCGL